jgi:hypothetical protein
MALFVLARLPRRRQSSLIDSSFEMRRRFGLPLPPASNVLPLGFLTTQAKDVLYRPTFGLAILSLEATSRREGTYRIRRGEQGPLFLYRPSTPDWEVSDRSILQEMMLRPSPEHCLKEMIDTQASERQHLGNENSPKEEEPVPWQCLVGHLTAKSRLLKLVGCWRARINDIRVLSGTAPFGFFSRGSSKYDRME